MSRSEHFHVGAEEHLEPRTFGPGGKYTTRAGDMWGHTPYNARSAKVVEAVHTNSGRRIGYLDWHEPSTNGDGSPTPHVQGSPDPTRSAIAKVVVSKNMRKKGIATAMLDHARDLRPGLQHSGPQALTADGAAWAKRRP